MKKKIDDQRCDVGSEYYDMVTEQMGLTVEYTKETIHGMVSGYEKRNEN